MSNSRNNILSKKTIQLENVKYLDVSTLSNKLGKYRENKSKKSYKTIKFVHLLYEYSALNLNNAFVHASNILQKNVDEAFENYIMAEVQCRLGNTVKAEFCFRRSLLVSPEFSEAENSLFMMRELQKHNVNIDTKYFVNKGLRIFLDNIQPSTTNTGLDCDESYIELKTSLENWGQSLLELTDELDLLDLNVSYTTCSEYHYLRGLYFSSICDYRHSIKSFQKAISLDSKYVEAYYELSHSFASCNSHSDAWREMCKVIEVAPQHATAYRDLKYLSHVCNYPDELVKIYDGAIRNHRGSSPPEISLGSRKRTFIQSLARLRNSPSILISTIPKSASTFLHKMLSLGITIPPTKIFVEYGKFGTKPIPAAFELFSKGGVECRQHFFPTEQNLNYFKKHGISKVLIHVRDPRQATLSWLYYQEAELRRLEKDLNFHIEPMSIIADLTFEESLEYYVKNWLPLLCDFMNAWIEVAEDELADIEVCFSTFEELAVNKDSFIARILSFWGIPKSWLNPSRLDGIVMKRRSGLVEEWRTVLSKDLQDEAYIHISDKIEKYFAYGR